MPLEGLAGWALHVLVLAWGAIWGSFANVAIWRVPRGASLLWPGSQCPACGEPVRWFDNVPVLSYALLRGRCRVCDTPISWRYPVVEAFCAGLALLVWARFPSPGLFVLAFFFTLMLVVVSAIDLELKIIPDRISYPGVPACVLAAQAFPGATWQDSLIGAAVGWGGVFVLAHAYRLLTGREGLGLGDGKLLAMVGGFLGWRALTWTILLGSLQGLVVSVPLLVWWRRQGRVGSVRRHEIPFGPFLAAGAFETLLAGDALMRALGALLGALA